jgi:aspartate-semialdehyde dehydrogenase
MAKIPVGILGATGMVGQWFARCLEDHPRFETAALAASERSAGKLYGELVRWNADGEMPAKVRRMPVHPIDPRIFSELGVRVLFSALPADQALVTEKALAEKGFFVFSNAAAFRMDPLTPILIPEANADHIRIIERQKAFRDSGGFVITNANCTTTGLVVALRPISDLFGIRRIVMSSYQALSGAGYPGVASLDITGNVIPFISNEDEKVERETKKILGPIAGGKLRPARFEVVASCTRVAVRYGHLETAVVELRKGFEEDEAKAAFRDFRWELSGRLPTAPRRPIILREEPDRPQPRLDCDAGEPERARGMAVSVGRVRKFGRHLRFYLLSHNTVRGAAGASILNAEYAKKLGYI